MQNRHHVEGLTRESYLGLTSLGSSKDSKEQRNRRPGDQLPWRCWTLTHRFVCSRRCNPISVLDFTMEHPSDSKRLFFFEAQDLIENFRKKVKSSDKPVKAKAQCSALAVFELFECQKSGRTTKPSWGCTRKLLRTSRSIAPSDLWGWPSTQAFKIDCLLFHFGYRE